MLAHAAAGETDLARPRPAQDWACSASRSCYSNLSLRHPRQQWENSRIYVRKARGRHESRDNPWRMSPTRTKRPRLTEVVRRVCSGDRPGERHSRRIWGFAAPSSPTRWAPRRGWPHRTHADL